MSSYGWVKWQLKVPASGREPTVVRMESLESFSALSVFSHLTRKWFSALVKSWRWRRGRRRRRESPPEEVYNANIFPLVERISGKSLPRLCLMSQKKMLNILMSSTIWLFVLFACMSLWRPTIHHQKQLFYSRVFSLVDEDHVKLLTVCFCTSIYVFNEFAREIANTSCTVLNNLVPFWYKPGNYFCTCFWVFFSHFMYYSWCLF